MDIKHVLSVVEHVPAKLFSKGGLEKAEKVSSMIGAVLIYAAPAVKLAASATGNPGLALAAQIMVPAGDLLEGHLNKAIKDAGANGLQLGTIKVSSVSDIPKEILQAALHHSVALYNAGALK